jgi:hypothetical protein
MPTLDVLNFVPAFAALLAVVALLSPSWRWVAGIIVAIGSYFAVLWFRHWLATQSPAYEEGRFGVLFYAAVTQAWIITLLIYIGSALWWRCRKWSSCSLRCNENLRFEGGE